MYGITMEEIVERAGIIDLYEVMAFCEVVIRRWPPTMNDRWTPVQADEAVSWYREQQ